VLHFHFLPQMWGARNPSHLIEKLHSNRRTAIQKRIYQSGDELVYTSPRRGLTVLGKVCGIDLAPSFDSGAPL
jgi:hypothetical protein